MIRIALGIAILGLGACSKQPVPAQLPATTFGPAITAAEPTGTAPAKSADEPEHEAGGTVQADEHTIACDSTKAVHHQEAPLGATRTSGHALTVEWMAGESEFIDEPPYNDPLDLPLDGVEYHYCGYSPSLGMHLVKKIDHGFFTGVLLDHRAGKRLDGGMYVTFSPDQERYFSSGQYSGVDGEDWLVRSRDGQTQWKGTSSITATTRNLPRSYEGLIGELVQPRWSRSGDLEATLHCFIGPDKERRFTVVLSNQQSQWRWIPEIDCAESNL